MSRTPPLVWGLLCAGVIGVSFAGAILQHLSEIPPLMRASWRLQLTSLMLLPMAIWQYNSMDQDSKNSLFEKNTLLILLGSGIALAAHFGTWVTSLDHTTLAHSLLFVTSHPLLIIVGIALWYRRPHRLETWGAIIGLTGACITLLDVQTDGEVTLYGDFLAFLGAVAVVGYILAGKVLRSWMPIFVYAFPVTALSALLLIPASFVMNEQTAAFGWASSELLPWFLLLAFLAGIVGHTGLNACLRWVSPLTISVAVTLEPMIGAFVGWLFFDASVPGKWTWLGGPLLIIGMILVIKGGHSSDLSIEKGPVESE